jgi:hypothetical protein
MHTLSDNRCHLLQQVTTIFLLTVISDTWVVLVTVLSTVLSTVISDTLFVLTFAKMEILDIMDLWCVGVCVCVCVCVRE